MEEISWGQRILGIETPESIAKINHQSELNFHNILNPFYHVLYPVSGVAFFLFCLILWIPKRNNRPHWFRFIFPHPSLFPLVFFILITSLDGESELMEVFLSLFALFYGWSVLLYNKHINFSKMSIEVKR
jgi:hypothetical protein